MVGVAHDRVVNQLLFTQQGQACSAGYTTADLGSPGSVPTQADIDAYAQAQNAIWLAGCSDNWKTFADVDTIYVGIKSSWIQASHTGATIVGHSSVASKAGTNGGYGPASQCVVCSLRTGLTGRSGRGRVYLPASGALPGGASKYGYSSSAVTGLATQFAQHLHDVDAITSPAYFTGYVPVVASLHLAAANAVASVKVDTRPDSQEHRERHQTYATATGTV
jgi:hypothetical protein